MEGALENIKGELQIDKRDWTLTKFGDVAIQQKKKVDRENTKLTRYVKGEHMGSEDLHLRSWGDLQDEYLGPAFIRRFDDGDILYGSRRTYLRKVVIAPFSGITSNTTLVIKANEKKIDRRLLPFVMMSEGFTENSIRNSKGSVNPYINWKDISKYEFLLPPKDQQAQFSELLWAMDEVVEREIDLKHKLKIHRDIHFENLVDESPGKKVKLSQILIPKKEKSQVPHSRNKYIGLEHLESGEFATNNWDSTESVKAQCNLVNEGDLCYSKLRPYLDKAIIATFDALSTTELLIYDTKKVSKEYVLYHFHSKAFIDYVSSQGFGTKMPRVSHKIIGEYEILVPNNEKEILNQMEQLLKVQGVIKSKISSSKALQKSLINQVF
ncbi:restriction endonuclease subunit S [Pareuzebyella sediminis]|uniref:restriction endonuclease subunit S n=1 Tax=Pareuzebyella sediminis TaxID=2607998 RepID=UPI0011EE8BF5|nr:restriction endonuclease subunit S [Pareuzebyella sediminis]